MRIAFVVNQLALGGAERQAADVALALARRGHTCVFFTFYGKLLLAEELEAGGVDVVPLEAGRHYWRGVPDLARRLRHDRFDVLNSHMSLAGAFARVAAVAARVPSVSVAAVRARVGDRAGVRKSVGVDADAVVVSNVGRFHPQKNQLRLVRAFA